MLSERYHQPPRAEKNIPITKQPLGMTRRGFLGVAANGGFAVVAAATIPSVMRNWPERSNEAPSVHESVVDAVNPAVELKEVVPVSSEAFLRSVEVHRQLQTLDRASVVFTDQTGAIVGDIVQFFDFTEQRGTRINKGGIEEPFFYLITPAAKDPETNEYVVDNIPPEWSDPLKEMHALSLRVDPETLTLQHAATEFVSAMKQDDEPELIAGIEAGTIRTRLDINRYFIKKDFKNSGGLNRVEYIKNHLTFSGNLAKSAVVTAELRRLIPGLCAVESGFDNEVENKGTGAKASFQFLPGTWHDELKRPAFVKNEELPFAEQVAAVGELFSKAYDRLKYWCYEEQNYQGRNYLEDIKALFSSQEDFEKYFFVPCLLNAHNTGEQGMGEVVVAFAQSKEFFAHMKAGGLNGFDLFHDMTRWAAASKLPQLKDFRNDASTYVEKIYAVAPMLGEYGGSDESVKVAEL